MRLNRLDDDEADVKLLSSVHDATLFDIDTSIEMEACRGKEDVELVYQEAIPIVKISQHVPSWDGLRGIAVLMTTACHCIPHSNYPLARMLGQGGVSIFFFLSGFLITGILVTRQTQNGNPTVKITYRHLGRFYLDRFVRLYPALLLMILITYTLKIILNYSKEASLRSVLLVLFYVSDLDQTTLDSIWSNTWSLSIEEQFYVVWALVLPLLLSSRLVKHRSKVLLIFISASLFCHYCDTSGLVKLPWLFTKFSSPFTSVWKMMVGAFIRLGNVPEMFKRPYCSWVGLLLLSLAVMTALSQPAIDLGSIGLDRRLFGHLVFQDSLAVLSASLIVCSTLAHGNALLESEPLRLIGRVSYSFYLFQFPIQRLGQESAAHGYGAIACSALALLLASISTFYIEEPIRKAYRTYWEKSGSSQ